MDFKLHSDFIPSGDQPEAIKRLTEGVRQKTKHQTLLGGTGTGKTFTMANVIQNIGLPTLVVSHNKTLAAQLYDEFKHFFPENAVHFFVSYYDYYQPEAYVPRTDTFIEKEATINEEIDRLRHAATTALLTRDDAIIVSSVSCIYGIGEPQEYYNQGVFLKVGNNISRKEFISKLVRMQYERNDQDFYRGKVRVKGDTVDVFPMAEEEAKRIEFFGDEITAIKTIDPLTGEIVSKIEETVIFPAKHFSTSRERIVKAIPRIQKDLDLRYTELKKEGKIVEAERLKQRTNFDIEMLEETGFCHGIENYSLYLSERNSGDPPFTLLDYFKFGENPEAKRDFLTIIDESHMTIPQIRGMYNGDRARKQTLVDHGFRLPTALDNRPLKFTEFKEREGVVVYTSATPGDYEISCSSHKELESSKAFFAKKLKGKETKGIVEQIIRPTGLLDPVVKIQPTEHQIDHLLEEVRERIKRKQRVLVTTLTKRMAEDLTEYLREIGIKVQYLHSDITTLERPEILRDLRRGVYDVIVGINLLREGIDLPEVSLVAILDADKEGFLRSNQALIQTIGRAARHQEGEVIMYADKTTGSMERAIEETRRRREIQENYNIVNKITPATIKKAISKTLKEIVQVEREEAKEIDITDVPKDEVFRILKEMQQKMELASRNLEFEKAAVFRDNIRELREKIDQKKIK